MNYDWTQIGAMTGALAIVAGLAVWLIRSSLVGTFIEARQFAPLEQRVATLETKSAGMATHSDVAALGSRVNGVEISVAGLKATLDGVHEGVLRTERMVELLVRNELREQPGELGAPR